MKERLAEALKREVILLDMIDDLRAQLADALAALDDVTLRAVGQIYELVREKSSMRARAEAAEAALAAAEAHADMLAEKGEDLNQMHGSFGKARIAWNSALAAHQARRSK